MIPPNSGSSLFHDLYLKRTPRENWYMLGYEGPNEISQGVLDRERTLIYLVNILDLDDETWT